MVSTSRNKSCKILFCLSISPWFRWNSVLLFRVFLLVESIIQICGSQFKKKNSLLLVETIFPASEKQFSSFVRYFWLRKQFSHQVETYFLTNSSFRLVETDFLSSGNTVFFYSELCRRFWNSGVANCLRETLFLLVEIDFLASGS